MAKSILVFEWMTGGGAYLESTAVPSGNDELSLCSEGAAMLEAVVADLTLCGVQPVVTIDSRFKSLQLLDATRATIHQDTDLKQLLFELASQVDRVLLIAPESESRLKQLVATLNPFARKLISPDLEFVELTSDKSATMDRLNVGGQKIPFGNRLDRWLIDSPLSSFPLPAMLKPNDGVGGCGNCLITDWKSSAKQVESPNRWRLEEWVDGQAASISVLCGHDSEENFFLPPTYQVFRDGCWSDCDLVLAPEKNFRALQLAKKTIHSLPETNGFVGIDFVFGAQAQDDTVIEVNPRLTSSYLKLRESVTYNIAEKMIEYCKLN